jgi:hypothetical protein
MKWCLFVLIASCIGIVGTSAAAPEPIHEVTCWEVLSSNSCNDLYGPIGPGSSHLCTACSSAHKCLYTDAAYYDEQEWDVGRGTVVPSEYGAGNAVGQLVFCYSVDTCQEDCELIPETTNYRCVYDNMEDVYEVIDETAWGDCP